MTTPADSLAGLGWHQSVGRAILAGIKLANEKQRADAVGATGTTMPGERRLYNTRKGKAVAHGLWPCCHPPGASADHWQPAVTSRQSRAPTMQTTLERPAESLDSFSALAAAVTPSWHQAILRLASLSERVAAKLDAWGGSHMGDGSFVRESRDLIETLIEFLDEIEPDPDLEPSLGSYDGRGNEDLEAEDEHDEPELGARDNVTDQNEAWRTADSFGHSLTSDREGPEDDLEPSLCGVTVEPGDDKDLEGPDDDREPSLAWPEAHSLGDCGESTDDDREMAIEPDVAFARRRGRSGTLGVRPSSLPHLKWPEGLTDRQIELLRTRGKRVR